MYLFTTFVTAMMAVAAFAAPFQSGGRALAVGSAGHIQNRQASGTLAQSTDAADPVSDLADNFVAGLEGASAVVEGGLGQITKLVKRQDDSDSGTLAQNVDVTDPVADLAVNVVGGLEGGLEVVSNTLGQILKS